MSLSTGAFKLEQDIPKTVIYTDSAYVSTTDASLNRRQTRFPPRNDVTFSPGGVREINFDISSSTSFIDWQKSYLSGKLTVKHTLAGADWISAALEKGGIHALFEDIFLENKSTSAPIQQCQKYNEFVAMMSIVSENMADSDEIYMDEFDSLSGDAWVSSKDKGSKGVYYNASVNLQSITTSTLAASFSVLDINAANSILAPWCNIKAGDIIGIGTVAATTPVLTGMSPSDPQNLRYVEATIWDGTNLYIILSASITPSSLTACAVVVYNNGNDVPMRTQIGSKEGANLTVATNQTTFKPYQYYFTMRPRIGYFKMWRFYPLFLHAAGINLRMMLDTAVFRSFFFNKVSQGAQSLQPTFDYELSDVRMNAVVYDFHSSINKQYLDAYKSKKGLLFPFHAYVYSQKDIGGADGDASVTMNGGVRSAYYVMGRLTTDKLYNTSNEVSLWNPSLSSYPLLGLEKYQYKSGTLVFPQRELRVGRRYDLETRKQWTLAFDKVRDRICTTFTSPESYNARAGYRSSISDTDIYACNFVNSAGTAYRDSNSSLFVAVLARELSGRFAGLDLSIQPLQIDMTFASALDSGIGSSRRFHQFVLYQSYAHLSEATGHTILK